MDIGLSCLLNLIYLFIVLLSVAFYIKEVRGGCDFTSTNYLRSIIRNASRFFKLSSSYYMTKLVHANQFSSHLQCPAGSPR